MRSTKKRKVVELSEHAVGSSARFRYDLALKRFVLFCSFFGLLLNWMDVDGVDSYLVQYLQYLYDENLPRVWGGDVISAAIDFSPRLKRSLPGSWRAFSAWGRLEPPKRAKPVAKELLRFWLRLLLVDFLQVSNELVVLSCIMHMLLVYHLIRPAEVRGLTWDDLIFEDELLNADGGDLKRRTCSIAIDHSKTSIRKNITEHVYINDAFTVFILEWLYDISTTDVLWPYSKTFFNIFLFELQRATDMKGYVPYSFKRGGATAHFARWRNYDKLVQAGRWTSINAARNYIDDAMSSLVRLRLSNEVRSQEPMIFLRRFLRKSGRAGSSLVLDL